MGGTVASVAGTEHTPRSSEPSGSRLEFETLISELSSRFINLSAGEVDGAIENALGSVCELLGIDLAVLWQWSATAPDVIAPTHAYPALEGLLPPEPLHEEQYPWVRAGDAGRPCGCVLFAWGSSRRRPPSTASTAATTASGRI